jgi:uncharacterized protein with HEPN domain
MKARAPEIPWKKIAGIRDKVVHDYVDVDLELVWEIKRNNLQPLKDAVQRLLEEAWA